MVHGHSTWAPQRVCNIQSVVGPVSGLLPRVGHSNSGCSSSPGWLSKEVQQRAVGLALSNSIDLPICHSYIGPAPDFSRLLGLQSSSVCRVCFTQQQQQQHVVEAAPKHVGSSASTYPSMAECSRCARCTMPAALHLDDAQLHRCWNRPLACSSCEQASGRLCVSRPLGASARWDDALGGILRASWAENTALGRR